MDVLPARKQDTYFLSESYGTALIGPWTALCSRHYSIQEVRRQQRLFELHAPEDYHRNTPVEKIAGGHANAEIASLEIHPVGVKLAKTLHTIVRWEVYLPGY